MEVVGRESVFAKEGVSTQHFAVDEIAACLNLNFSSVNLSEDRTQAFYDNCVLVYKTLVPIFKKKQDFPVTITLSDQTQLTITESQSELTFTSASNSSYSQFNIPFKTALSRLYPHIQGSWHFFEIARHQQAYRSRGWMGNFYYKNLPSPEQLEPDYKKTPYVTIDDVAPVNLNGRAPFSYENPVDPSWTKIFCRHLAAKCFEDVITEKTGRGKFSLVHYDSEASLTNHVKAYAEEIHARLRNNASSYDLIDNDLFGRHLQQCFNDMGAMPKSKKGSHIKTLLVDSTSHTMMVRLRIKPDEDGRPIYVVKFYDPNITNKTCRVETDDLSTLEPHTLKLYIAGVDFPSSDSRYSRYFNDDAQICMVMDCSSKGSTKTKRRLNSVPALASLTPDYMHHLIRCNFFSALIGLTSQLEEIGKQSPDKLVQLLAAKRRDGLPGFSMMGQLGYADGIKAYGEWILKFSEIISPDQQLELLAAKTAEGIPVLYFMMKHDQPETMQAYGEVIEQLIPMISDANLLIQILTVKMRSSTSEQVTIFKPENEICYAGYGELLYKFMPYLSKNQRIEMLVAKLPDGMPALYKFVEAKDEVAIRFYRAYLFHLLNDEERTALFDILCSTEEKFMPSIHQAMTDKNEAVIKTRGEMLQLISDWREK